MASVPATADPFAATSLTPRERLVVRDALARLLRSSVLTSALSGSTAPARGEPGHDESDVDLLVLTRNGRSDFDIVYRAIYDAAVAQGASPAFFSVWVEDPEWLAQRRSVRSFFIQEVDRDKVVLADTL